MSFFRKLGTAMDIAMELEKLSESSVPAGGHVRQVAVYKGLSTFSSNLLAQFTITRPTEWEGLLFTPTESGVKVSYFGRWGSEEEHINKGDDEWLFDKKVTIAVI